MTPHTRRTRRPGRPPCSLSALLLDADHVAGGIAEGAVANPVRLLGGLLDDLDVAGLHPLERAVQVLCCQDDLGISALGHHLGDEAALVVGGARGGGRRGPADVWWR